MVEDNNFIEESRREVVRTYHESNGQTNNTVNVEQNINVVNIEMGNKSLLDKIDVEQAKEWLQSHMMQVIIGAVLAFYTVLLIIMSLAVARYRDMLAETASVKMETGATIPAETESVLEVAEPVEETPAIQEEPVVAQEPIEEIEGPKEEGEEELSEPVTEKNLYELRIVGGTNSEKRAKATNTVGEELENVFYLTGGFYNETVGFYLNGKYDHFKANLSCDDNCRGGFYVNVYLDDGECLQSIRVERLMARTPIDIDTTGAEFIKFEITGSMYSQGALLSDGVLHVLESEER